MFWWFISRFFKKPSGTVRFRCEDCNRIKVVMGAIKHSGTKAWWKTFCNRCHKKTWHRELKN